MNTKCLSVTGALESQLTLIPVIGHGPQIGLLVPQLVVPNGSLGSPRYIAIVVSRADTSRAYLCEFIAKPGFELLEKHQRQVGCHAWTTATPQKTIVKDKVEGQHE